MAAEVGAVLSSRGVVAARCAWTERRAQQLGRWDVVRQNLFARLEQSAGSCTQLKGVAAAAGCAHIAALTFETLRHREDAVAAALKRVQLRDLLSLYRYYRYFGDFRIAALLREAAIAGSLRAQHGAAAIDVLALTAAIERGETGRALELISTKRVRRQDRAEVRDIHAMALALGGELSKARELWKRDFDDADCRFHRFVSGRSVAIVGPALPQDEAGPEIDSFDVVVRTNYRIGSNHPIEKYGTRTDVSYYNHHRMRFHRDEVLEVGQTLPWIVLKSRGDEAEIRKACSARLTIRTTFLADAVLFGEAYPMAIQNILSDLLRFAPARLKLFSTTFYGAPGLYSERYRAIPVDAQHISQSLRFHELFSCRAFVQNLRAAGVCEVDDLTASVLDMSQTEYAAVIQERYGTHTY